MKNYLKTGILLFGISLLLWNCEKDTTTVIENQSIETDNSLSQDDISIQSFDFEKFKEFPLYSQLDNFVKFNAKSRISKKKEHKFKIHKNTFKKITKKDIDYTSYTFLISDTENFEYTTVQNLVINQYKKNIEVFIFTYNSFDISDEHKYNINENVVVEQLFDFDISELGDLASKDGILIDGLGGDGTGDGEPSSGGGSSTYCYNVSIIIDYPCYGSGSLGTNHANCQCGTSVAPNCTQPHQEYYSEIFCTTEFDSSTTAGSYYISNNYSPTGGGGTPNVTTTDNNIIISSIIKNEIPEGADPLAFKLNLDSLSEAYKWVVNTASVAEYDQIGLFLEENGLSTEAINFAKLAIEAKLNGGDVDYVDNIINNLKGKQECVYGKLVNLNLFKETIGKFTANPNYHIQINNGECPNSLPGTKGCSNGSYIENGLIIINISSNYGPNLLDLAQTILHEGIHAELTRYVYSVNNNLGLDSNNDRPRLMELYMEYKGLNSQSSQAQHYYMTENYVKPIAAAIRELDNNKYPIAYYMGFGWDGLARYGLKSKMLTETQILENERLQKIVNDNTLFNNGCK